MAQCLKSQNESKHTSAVRTMTEACPGWRQVRLGSWMTQRLKTRGFQENTTTTTTEVVKTFGQWKQIARKIVFHSCRWKNSTLCCWLIWDLLLMFRNEKKGMVALHHGLTISMMFSLFALEIMFNEPMMRWFEASRFQARASRCQTHHAFECIAKYSSDLEMLNGVGSRNEAHVFQDSRGTGTYVFANPK